MPVLDVGPDSGGGGPCAPWLEPDSPLLCCLPEEEPTDEELEALTLAIGQSTALLYYASGRQYPGVCEWTVRPCQGDGIVQWVAYAYTGGSRPLTVNGQAITGGGGGDCLYGGAGILLPGDPVNEIVEVKINGTALDPSEYRLSGNVLLRRDGSWPCSQELAREDTEDRTWSITYSAGRAPDPAGLRAAADLACELLNPCDPGTGDSCLPESVQSLVRENVTMEFIDETTVGDGLGLRFGLRSVDRWLEAVNPHGLDRPGKWFSLATIGDGYT